MSYIILLAVSGEDHSHLRHIVTFEKCSREACEYIIIIDDRMVERDETLYVTLGRTSDLDERIRLHPTEQRVKILNDDGDCALQWLLLLVLIVFTCSDMWMCRMS